MAQLLLGNEFFTVFNIQNHWATFAKRKKKHMQRTWENDMKAGCAKNRDLQPGLEECGKRYGQIYSRLELYHCKRIFIVCKTLVCWFWQVIQFGKLTLELTNREHPVYENFIFPFSSLFIFNAEKNHCHFSISCFLL